MKEINSQQIDEQFVMLQCCNKRVTWGTDASMMTDGRPSRVWWEVRAGMQRVTQDDAISEAILLPLLIHWGGGECGMQWPACGWYRVGAA